MNATALQAPKLMSLVFCSFRRLRNRCLLHDFEWDDVVFLVQGKWLPAHRTITTATVVTPILGAYSLRKALKAEYVTCITVSVMLGCHDFLRED